MRKGKEACGFSAGGGWTVPWAVRIEGRIGTGGGGDCGAAAGSGLLVPDPLDADSYGKPVNARERMTRKV